MTLEPVSVLFGSGLYKAKRLVADECHSGCGFGLHCNWGWDWITLNESDWYVVKILYL
jgi:hypothetical protein